MRFFWGVFRWCRCAQPPASRCDAYGIRFVAFNDLGHRSLSQYLSLRSPIHPSFFTAQKYDFLLPTENREERWNSQKEFAPGKVTLAE
jgi:hypothetical protein